LLISIIDKKPPAEVSSSLSHDVTLEKSPKSHRQLGIRDLPMPPVPSDVDDDVDNDEMDELTEQELQKKEDELCDSIVKSFLKNKQELSSSAETYQQPPQQYVLMMVVS